MKLSEILTKLQEKGLNLTYNLKRDFEVKSLLPLNLSDESSISYLELDKYIPHLENSKAGAIIVREDLKDKIKSNAIITNNPNVAMAYISGFFELDSFRDDENKNLASGIAKNARIMPNVFTGSNVNIGENTTIMPGVVICDNVSIGKNCKIYPNVVIYSNTKIGNNVRLHAGSIIGSDGYGYAHNEKGEHIKIIHSGGVIIEDDVEIGANTTIDRAVFENTIIKKGAKIDNLVQIGHNCVIGENTLIVSQSGVAGSATLGRNVVVGGQTAIGGHIHIGDFAQIGGKSGTVKNLEGGKQYRGIPAVEIREYEKFNISLRKLVRNMK